MRPNKAEERSSLALYAAGTNTMHSLFLPLGCVIYRIRGQFLWNCFFNWIGELKSSSDHARRLNVAEATGFIVRYSFKRLLSSDSKHGLVKPCPLSLKAEKLHGTFLAWAASCRHPSDYRRRRWWCLLDGMGSMPLGAVASRGYPFFSPPNRLLPRARVTSSPFVLGLGSELYCLCSPLLLAIVASSCLAMPTGFLPS